MEFYFFPDVYADRFLVDYYIVAFKLKDKGCVETREWEGREYITRVLDWECFKRSAYDIVIYEFGDELARFSDIETALSDAYKMACLEASRRVPSSIVPATGIGSPPVEVIKKVFPMPFDFEPFPEDVDSFLDQLVKKVEVQTIEKEHTDDDEIPF
ncbi:MAG: hypothetical protein D6674_03105 [Acidobacteria bacterium]|jgi:hypothetical protein|nr:MAG: hypothetical protein D6674_03105 [Acidobacteriota bacterium]